MEPELRRRIRVNNNNNNNEFDQGHGTTTQLCPHETSMRPLDKNTLREMKDAAFQSINHQPSLKKMNRPKHIQFI